MENASDALKMAAAVLILVIALSYAIYGFTKARQAATAILSKSDNIEYYNTDNIKVGTDRIVGIETVIPTLYSYFKEGYTVLFYTGNIDENGNLTGEITPMTLYYSEALTSRLRQSTLRNERDTSYIETDSNGSFSRAIYGVDANDEDTRQEPWLHDESHAKLFIQSLINNTTGTGAPQYDFSRPKFTGSPNKLGESSLLPKNKLVMTYEYVHHTGEKALSRMTQARFIERLGTYNAVTSSGNPGQVNDENFITSVDSSVINFSNNETIQNDEGVQKRIIQYIYIGNNKY